MSKLPDHPRFPVTASTSFLDQLTGSFAMPAAENPTVAMVEAAYRHHGLAWRWNDYGRATNPAYLLFLAAFVTTMYAYMPPGSDHKIVAITVSSFAISRAIYGGRGMTGSMWCFFAALVPWLSFAL